MTDQMNSGDFILLSTTYSCIVKKLLHTVRNVVLIYADIYVIYLHLEMCTQNTIYLLSVWVHQNHPCSFTGWRTTWRERGKSLLKVYLSCSSPLRQLKIRPGRKDLQVQKRVMWCGKSVFTAKVNAWVVTSVFLLIREVHLESGQLRQLRVVWGVEGWQSDKQSAWLQGAETGIHWLYSGGGYGGLP